MTSEQAAVDFDPIFERQLIIARSTKTIGLYISQDYSAK